MRSSGLSPLNDTGCLTGSFALGEPDTQATGMSWLQVPAPRVLLSLARTFLLVPPCLDRRPPRL